MSPYFIPRKSPLVSQFSVTSLCLLLVTSVHAIEDSGSCQARDKMLPYSAAMPDCPSLQGPSDAPQWINKVPAQFTKTGDAKGDATHWSHDRVSAPAMNQRVQELLNYYGVKNPTVKVAVYDDFDDFIADVPAQNILKPFFDVHEPLQFKSFHSIKNRKSGEIHSYNHGFAVTSVIAGQGSFGVSKGGLNLSLYNMKNMGLPNQGWSQITDICDQLRDPKGVVIINRSVGIRADHKGEHSVLHYPIYHTDFIADSFFPIYQEELRYPDLMNALKEKGCLVVNAAGNSGFRGTAFSDGNDALLQVGATDSNGNLYKTSDEGEVYAPGANVAVMHFLQDDGAPQLRRQAMLRSGTSYAAPVVSGILAEAQRVLKMDQYFEKLIPAARVELLNDISFASSATDSKSQKIINGRNAVELAHLWNVESKKRGEPLSPKSIFSLRYNDLKVSQILKRLESNKIGLDIKCETFLKNNPAPLTLNHLLCSTQITMKDDPDYQSLSKIEKAYYFQNIIHWIKPKGTSVVAEDLQNAKDAAKPGLNSFLKHSGKIKNP